MEGEFITLTYSGGDKLYNVRVDDEPCYATPDRRDALLFIAELKVRTRDDKYRNTFLKLGGQKPLIVSE